MPALKTVPLSRSLSEALQDTLRFLCAALLVTVDELSYFGRIPVSTRRDRLRSHGGGWRERPKGREP